MQRITISLPERVAEALGREARRRRVPVAQVARDAIEEGLAAPGPRLPFAALGRSGHRTTARDLDEILAGEWGDARDR